MKKKLIAFLMVAILSIGMTACGKSDTETKDKKSQYSSGEEILSKVYEGYKEEQKFPIYGGDIEHYVEDKPAPYEISGTEQMDFELGFPESQSDNIDAVATMVHSRNANIFTGAAYHLKSGVDVNSFATAIKENIWNPDRHWLCGAPDTLLIIAVDQEYVITVFGKKAITDVFKENALSALEGSSVILEETASQG